MNRRRALVTIGLTALSRVGWSITRPRLLLSTLGQTALAPSGTGSERAVEERLQKDLATLKPLVYSEEGIPMFLGCENVAPASQQTAKVVLTPTNTALAAAFRRDAKAWARMHPDAQAKDVAKLVEVLAHRDFTLGTEQL